MTDGWISWRSAALGFLIPLGVIAAATFVRPGTPPARPARQPIAFNHRKHVEENSLPCSLCHEFYEKEAFSGLPATEICAGCHLEPQGKSKREQELVGLLKAGKPLDWAPLFRQPPHVFYSHRRHVVAAKIDCPVCHGEIAKTSEPPAIVRRLAMQDCLDCHRRRGVSTECTTCHR